MPQLVQWSALSYVVHRLGRFPCMSAACLQKLAASSTSPTGLSAGSVSKQAGLPSMRDASHSTFVCAVSKVLWSQKRVAATMLTVQSGRDRTISTLHAQVCVLAGRRLLAGGARGKNLFQSAQHYNVCYFAKEWCCQQNAYLGNQS